MFYFFYFQKFIIENVYLTDLFWIYNNVLLYLENKKQPNILFC